MSLFDITPTVHFHPPKNWMNDPNGTICEEGVHHLYYQYNPAGKEWGNIHWGHAVTQDLVHFEHLPVALYPSKERGEHHCFSGSVIKKENQFYFFYTSVGVGARDHVHGAEQWLIVTEDLHDLSAEKRVVLTKDVHPHLEVTEWRDPFVYEENGIYYLLLAGVIDGSGHILQYQSADLIHWTFTKTLLSKKDVILECPNIVRFGDHYVLIWCEIESRQVMYAILDQAFRCIKERPFDYSQNTYYATNLSRNEQGEVLVWAWLQEGNRPACYDTVPWVGTTAMIKKLRFDGAEIQLAPAVDYFSECVAIHTIKPEFPLRGLVFHLSITLFPGNHEILLAPSAGEQITIRITERQVQCIHHLGKQTSETIVPFDPAEEITLDLFGDNSILEGIMNHQYSFTTRIYPKELNNPTLLIHTPETMIKKVSLRER